MLYKFFFYAIIYSAITNSCRAGGPWAQGKGHGFAQDGFSSTVYKNVFDTDGNGQDAFGKFYDFTFQSYSELGLSDKITLKIISPYKYLSGESSILPYSKQRLQGAGNITLGASYLWVDKKIKIATRLEIASRGKNDKNSPSLYNLKTGYTEFEVSPFLSIGASTYKCYWYADIGTGLTKNSVFKFYGEAGYSVFKKLKAAAVMDARIPFKTDNSNSQAPVGIISSSFLYDPLQQYIGTGLKLIYTYKEKYGISASVFGAFLARRVSKAPALNVGLFYKW